MKYALVLVSAGLAMAATTGSESKAASPEQATQCQPCYKVEAEETACKDKSSPQDQAACLCANQYFSQWRECRDCKRKEEAQRPGGNEPAVSSQREAWFTAYSSVMDIASPAFCTGTPTASWQAVFSSAAASRGVDGAGVTPSVVAPAVSTGAVAGAGPDAPRVTPAPGAAVGAEASANADAVARVAGDGEASASAGANAAANAYGDAGSAYAEANADAWAKANGNGAEAGANAGAKAGANGVETSASASTSVFVPGAVPTAKTTAAGGNAIITGGPRNNSTGAVISGADAGKLVSGLALAVAGAAAVMAL